MAEEGSTPPADVPSAAPLEAPSPRSGPLSTTAETAAPVGSLAGGDDLLTPTSSVQLLASLALVLAVIVGLGWLSRRLNRLQPRRARSLQMIDVLPVGARERVALVQVGSTQLVLGLAPGRVQTLHVLDTPPADEQEVASERDGPSPAIPPFASLLKR